MEEELVNKQHDARGVGVGLLGSIVYEQVNCDGHERGDGTAVGSCTIAGASIPTIIWNIAICKFTPDDIGCGKGKGCGDITGKGLG